MGATPPAIGAAPEPKGEAWGAGSLASCAPPAARVALYRVSGIISHSCKANTEASHSGGTSHMVRVPLPCSVSQPGLSLLSLYHSSIAIQ